MIPATLGALFAIVGVNGSLAHATTSVVVVAPTASAAVGGSGLLTGGSVSGFGGGDSVRVVVSTTNGTLELTSSASGVSVPFGYPAVGSSAASVAFEGTQSQVNDALGAVSWAPASTGDSSLDVSAVLGGATYDPANGHYYEVVDNGSSIAWSAAKTAAATKTFNGLQGYLATITSSDENSFLAQKTADAAWIGATEDASYGAPGSGTSTGNYTWVTGPEAGTVFWVWGTCDFGLQGTCSSTGGYANFNTGEPNRCCGGIEHYLEFNFPVGSGHWNDYDDANPGVSKYLVEFGGDGGTVDAEGSASGTASAYTTPDAPTSVVATAAEQSATVSWAAPASDGNSAIQSYVVSTYTGSTLAGTQTVTAPATTANVTGLTGGTSYTFTVTATNAAGTGSPSSASAAVVPLAPSSLALSTTGASYVFGDTATLVAAVTGLSPTGTVSFSQDGMTLGTASVGGARVTTGALTVGTHTFSAQYGGDGVNTGSSATIQLTVDRAPATLSPTAPSDAVYGRPATLAVGGLSDSATGSVAFSAGGTDLCTATVAAGAAACPAALPGGTSTVHASYTGDSNFLAATADVAVTVAPAPVTLALTVTRQSSGAYAFSASGLPAGATGTVVFRAGSRVICSASVSSATTCTAPLGSRVAVSVVASYSGDADYRAATSAPVGVTPPPAPAPPADDDAPDAAPAPADHEPASSSAAPSSASPSTAEPSAPSAPAAPAAASSSEADRHAATAPPAASKSGAPGSASDALDVELSAHAGARAAGSSVAITASGLKPGSLLVVT
ncbi:MAG TPA: Ig-like domain repeat protein, partial [Gaiellaceae bacterium]|nr:Ig-like domain repeat protein [Gaiellaceae bacterium]